MYIDYEDHAIWVYVDLVMQERIKQDSLAQPRDTIVALALAADAFHQDGLETIANDLIMTAVALFEDFRDIAKRIDEKVYREQDLTKDNQRAILRLVPADASMN